MGAALRRLKRAVYRAVSATVEPLGWVLTVGGFAAAVATWPLQWLPPFSDNPRNLIPTVVGWVIVGLEGFGLLPDQIDDEVAADVCPHGDPTCPCPDGDPCHYVSGPGPRGWTYAERCPRTGLIDCDRCPGSTRSRVRYRPTHRT